MLHGAAHTIQKLFKGKQSPATSQVSAELSPYVASERFRSEESAPQNAAFAAVAYPLQGRGGFVYARAAAPPVRRGPLADDGEPTREPRQHLDHDYEFAAARAADARRPRAPAATDRSQRARAREHVVRRVLNIL